MKFSHLMIIAVASICTQNVFSRNELMNSTRCEEKQELRYIYDPDYNECYAIRLKECEFREQTEEIFSLAQCIVMLSSTHKCAGLSKPVARPDGTSHCDTNDETAPNCTEKAVCKGNVCCDSEFEHEYLTEKYSASCPPGVKAYREHGQILFSRNCSVNFCPGHAECIMGINFAFCCPPF